MTDIPTKPVNDFADCLVQRARTDREALGKLYDLTYPHVFRYCLRRSGNRGLAEDITSIVFLKVASGVSGFSGAGFQEFRRWVFTIATNELNADSRKTARRLELLGDAANAGQLRDQTSGEVFEETPERDILQTALLNLSDRAQAIIVLRFYSELSYEDIAVVLDMSPGAVRTAASRALEEMRNELGNEK